MVFKVFCDINVSHITSEDLNKNENICYDIIPKYDDNKENWDPNESKKNSAISSSLTSPIPSKNEQKINELKSENRIENIENCSKEDSVKKDTPNEDVSPKQDSKNENLLNKESAYTENIKNEKVKNENLKASTTTELKEEKGNSENLKDNSKIVEKKEIQQSYKRQRAPLEDITYMFVKEKPKILSKRIKIVKNEQEKSSISLKAIKTEELSSKKEDKELNKCSKISSENLKENKQPIRKTPLGNVHNRSNINIFNNNLSIKNNDDTKKDIPKPFFIDVKKSKTFRKTLIPKKSLKAKPNPFNSFNNVSARMLR
ncbi:hypothetical protein BCR36DRAFT_364161 [Piromyces finnis]|uniref:Uncharacterized protein n=1 Tax=Piromyces finnis TaxID=1754191 RepID=A0A1Y1UU29_9FUNG|nr:hypothetical protein BCR36DRAFT_364161 [Piromyces finnis]|eukprot:ORX41519.1 hypothetical protein BCR36DRAFT_364161 [Piromyces finnis]